MGLFTTCLLRSSQMARTALFRAWAASSQMVMPISRRGYTGPPKTTEMLGRLAHSTDYVLFCGRSCTFFHILRRLARPYLLCFRGGAFDISSSGSLPDLTGPCSFSEHFFFVLSCSAVDHHAC